MVWGDKHLQPSAEACCNACANYKPANDDEFSCNGVLAGLGPCLVSCCSCVLAALAVLPYARGGTGCRAVLAFVAPGSSFPKAHADLEVHGAVWVHCGDAQACGDRYQQCWLKHLVRAVQCKSWCS